MIDKRNVILGISSGYSFGDLKPFIGTLKATNFKGELVLFMNNTTSRSLKKLEIANVKCITYKNTYPYFEAAELNDSIRNNIPPLSPNSLRYFFYEAFLKAYGHLYNYVMITDVRDVVFQKDPFDFNILPGLYSFLEDADTRMGQQEHNKFWIRHGFGEEVIEEMRNNRIACSGVTIGDVPSMQNYFDKMTPFLETIKNVGGMDQGVHNYLIHTNQIQNLHLIEDDQGPVSTLSTFKDFKKLRFNKKGEIINHQGKAINIVHQYDRHLHLLKKYSLRNYFIKRINLTKKRIYFIKEAYVTGINNFTKLFTFLRK